MLLALSVAAMTIATLFIAITKGRQPKVLADIRRLTHCMSTMSSEVAELRDVVTKLAEQLDELRKVSPTNAGNKPDLPYPNARKRRTDDSLINNTELLG
jgi:signal transduction histidine kinase